MNESFKRQLNSSLTGIDVGPSKFGHSIQQVTYRSTIDGLSDWALLEKPSSATCRRWVINLHGHGSCGDQLYTRPDIRDDWLPHFRELGLGILAPNLRGNSWMSPVAAIELRDLLRWLRRTYDAFELLLVGGSMGGTGCIAFAGMYPEEIAAVVAMCPATDIQNYHRWCKQYAQTKPALNEIRDAIEKAYSCPPEQRPEVYTAHRAVLHTSRLLMPLALIHGDNDDVIPVEQSQILAKHLLDESNFIYKELPDGDHNAPLAHCREGLDWALQKLGGG